MSVAINILEIKETFFMIREDLCIADPNRLVIIDLYHRIGVNTDVKRVKFTLGVFLHYQDKSDKLAEMIIDTVFELPNMNEYNMEGDDLILPGEILLIIVRESISHLRALFYKKVQGTVYHQVVIPYDDAQKVTAHFFPTLIRNEKGIMPDLIGKVEA